MEMEMVRRCILVWSRSWRWSHRTTSRATNGAHYKGPKLLCQRQRSCHVATHIFYYLQRHQGRAKGGQVLWQPGPCVQQGAQLKRRRQIFIATSPSRFRLLTAGQTVAQGAAPGADKKKGDSPFSISIPNRILSGCQLVSVAAVAVAHLSHILLFSCIYRMLGGVLFY